MRLLHEDVGQEQEHVVRDDEGDGVENAAAPQHEVCAGVRLRQGYAKERWADAGQQVAQPEDADVTGFFDEYHHCNLSEEVVRDTHLQHVKVGIKVGTGLGFPSPPGSRWLVLIRSQRVTLQFTWQRTPVTAERLRAAAEVTDEAGGVEGADEVR